MVSQCWTLHSGAASSSQNSFFFTFSQPKTHPKFNLGRFPRKKSNRFTCFLNLTLEDVAQIAHNKVLIAAGVSAAIGQLTKPFTSVVLYGKDLDFKATIQAGGFPSTHSSSVVAAATSLALERGFSDSIFGLTMVYAGLIMYDAQGVRREVGNQARALNKVLGKPKVNLFASKDINGLIDSGEGMFSTSNVKKKPGALFSKKSSSVSSKYTNSPLLVKSEDKVKQTDEEGSDIDSANISGPLKESIGHTDVEVGSDIYSANISGPLKESIGHTEVEVVAGALLGFFVSLAVYSIM